MSPPRMRWTVAERVQLEELVRSGHTDKRVAKAMGRSPYSVTKERRRQGLRRGQYEKYAWFLRRRTWEELALSAALKGVSLDEYVNWLLEKHS